MSPRQEKKKPPLWKDHIDRAAVQHLAKDIQRAYRPFQVAAFVRHVCGGNFLKLELKERLRCVTIGLKSFLPESFPEAAKVLTKAAPRLPGFSNWILTGYVEEFGLDDFRASIATLEELTKHGTSEFGIRPFMVKYPQKMTPVLHRWAKDANEHVRRLAAEASRPRGVWVAHLDAFKKDPRPVLDLLGLLKADDSLYVRKAVANNLNDISRDNPEAAIATARAWLKSGDKNTEWIVRHGCRTLIKAGRPEVLKLFGFTADPKIEIKRLKLVPKKITNGGDLVFSFDIVSKASKKQKLAVDYAIHFRLATGRLSRKVFKLGVKTIAAGETIALSKKHSFRPATTRKIYPGRHCLEILVNGQAPLKVDFVIVA